MLLADLVQTSDAVAETPSRSAKLAALTRLLKELAPAEIEPAVAFLAGQPQLGKVGAGWSTLHAVDPPSAAEASIEVVELDRVIGELQSLSGPGSATGRRQRLAELLARATAAEADFIRRLLIGALRQGALEGVMTDGVARASGVGLAAVRRAVMLAGDLPRVAALALTGGEPALAGIRLEVLRPVLPMLASSADDVATALGALGKCSIEWKLDGIRIQAHHRGDEVRLYTRNLNDATDRLPGVAAAVRALEADSVVLDGEVVGVPSTAWFFDCLHLDGDDLLDRPLLERSAELYRLGAPRVPSLVTDDVDAAVAFEADALAAGHEGVMVKAASSLYEAGRRGAAWRKVKPVRTLDLVVLGAEWGSGRRRGWLSNLHLGARLPEGGYVMVGKTFKGLTDALLEWQTSELLRRESGRHGYVVEIDPPLVVEIALDGAMASTRYPGGVGLRFARVRRYREDKDPQEADTIDALRAMLSGQPREN